MQLAEAAFGKAGFEVSVLDLSRVASEYGRHIHPCKACFSTSPALCHWPCSCYPNYSLGQTHDWMNEIYPLWVAAHGIMIVTPIHWYQATSPLKLMIDRLVCADGGNPDPSSTRGKNAAEAQAIELNGWDYPRHLAGRAFSVVMHGDTEGVLDARRALVDWLISMELKPAGQPALLDRYIGYWKPYATSQEELDRETALQQEVQLAATTLADKIIEQRTGNAPRHHERPPRKVTDRAKRRFAHVSGHSRRSSSARGTKGCPPCCPSSCAHCVRIWLPRTIRREEPKARRAVHSSRRP